MAGVAGAVIGLTSGAQPNIAGAKALADGTTTARGCTTNFIGFGLGLTSEEPLPVDFVAADDTVTLAITGGSAYEPTYTAVVDHPDRETLSWADTTP